MKQGWELKTLEDVCQFQNGFAFKSKTFKDEGVPVLRISNIQKDNIDLRRIVFVDPSDYKEDLSKYVVNKGDLLIAMSGATTGKIGFNNTDDVFYLNQRVGKFKPSEQLNIHYLYYFLSTQVEENLKISAGSAQPNLSTQQIKSFKLPFPPLEEQKQIVAKLDQCFEAIDKARANAAKNLENAKELFQSKLNDIFSQKGEGWVEQKLGDVCKLIDSLHKTPSYIKEGGFPMIRVTDIKDGFVNFKNARRVNKDVYGEFSKRHIASIGDLVLSRVGSYGIPAIVETDTLFCLGQNTVFLIPLINTYWIYYFLISPNSKQQMDKSASGVAQPTVSLKAIKQINIPIPSLEEQKQIVKILDSLRRQIQSLESKYQQELNSLEELKKSILQKAFEGEL